MKPGRFRPTVMNRDANEYIFRAFLRVLDKNIKIPVIVKYTRIQQLVFKLFPRAPPVGLDQVQIGILTLRVLVEVLHVRVRRRAVEIEVVLLDILAVVRLAVGEPEQALFQNWIALVPQRQRKAQPLLVIRQSAKPVFTPAVGT